VARIAAPLAAILRLVCAETTYASSCGKIPYRRDLKEAEAIFIGEVLDIRDSGDRHYPLAVTLKTERFFKGTKQPQLTVLANFGVPLGFFFHKGERYLVYAFSKRLEVPTNCGPSGPLVTDPIYGRQYTEQKNRIAKLDDPLYRLFVRLWPF
jgi:hypothetical protein